LSCIIENVIKLCLKSYNLPIEVKSVEQHFPVVQILFFSLPLSFFDFAK